jgi:hypothetical protein
MARRNLFTSGGAVETPSGKKAAGREIERTSPAFHTIK